MRTAIVGAVVAVLLVCGQAGAQLQNPFIVVDENGMGSFQPYPGQPPYYFEGTLMPDPTGG